MFPLVLDVNPNEYDEDNTENEVKSAEDEVSNAPATKGPLRCSIGSRPCRDGTDCVLFNHVCDGEFDCKDGSDEDECPLQCESGEETAYSSNTHI